MFIKMNMFKNLLKKAWQGAGLTVGNDGEGIFLIGTYWSIWLERWWMSNKTKATIIEFAGELPKEGEVFKCWKGQDNQYEMEQIYTREFYNPSLQESKVEYINTGVSVEEFNGECTILQNKKTQENIIIAKHIVDMVDNGSREEGEQWVENPVGRYYEDKKTTEIYWQNEACTLGCMVCEPKEGTKTEMLMELLKAYDFAEGRKHG